jgi:hypothetical protein
LGVILMMILSFVADCNDPGYCGIVTFTVGCNTLKQVCHMLGQHSRAESPRKRWVMDGDGLQIWTVAVVLPYRIMSHIQHEGWPRG